MSSPQLKETFFAVYTYLRFELQWKLYCSENLGTLASVRLIEVSA